MTARDCSFEYLAYLLQLSKALGIRSVFSNVSSLPCPVLPASCAQCLWCSTAPAASSFLRAHHVVRRSRVPVLWHSQVLPASLLSLLDLGAQLPLVLPLDCWLLWQLPGQPWQQKDALVTYGKYDVGAIITQVTNGNGSMPAFGDKLGPDDIEDSAWCTEYYRIV